MRIYYKQSKLPINNSLLKYPEEALDVNLITPKPFQNIHNFLWSLCSLLCSVLFIKRVFVEYQLIKDKKVVCTAEVVSWIPIFPFMPYKGLHIGPCKTIPEERGRGYYPYLLAIIQQDFPNRECYMIVKESNAPSIRGVCKAGFVAFAKGIKKYGRYITTEKL